MTESPAPTTARPGMVKLCEVFLEPMRTKFGPCHVLSGYRHTLYNAMIGGARQSPAHLRRRVRVGRRRHPVREGQPGPMGR